MELEKKGNVFILTLKSNENRFNPNFISQIHDQLNVVEKEEGDRSLIITAEGKFFSNGLDLNWCASDPARFPQLLEVYQKLLARLLTFPVPTIAAINGHMYAGGFMFGIACDVLLMQKERGFVCMPEIDLNMPLSDGMCEVNERSPNKAILRAKLTRAEVRRDVILFGKKYNADEAKEAGIIHHSVPSQSLLNEAMNIANSLAAKGGQDAYRRIKSTFHYEAFQSLQTFEVSGDKIVSKL